jgi:DNA-directed RNA polymerase subunit RPC12/RpoP
VEGIKRDQINTIKCPHCGSDRIVSKHATTAADGVNYQKEFRCLNCGLRFDQKISIDDAGNKPKQSRVA